MHSLQHHKPKTGVSHVTSWRTSIVPIHFLKYFCFILNEKNSTQTHKFLGQYTSVSVWASKEEGKENTTNRTANIVVYIHAYGASRSGLLFCGKYTVKYFLSQGTLLYIQIMHETGNHFPRDSVISSLYCITFYTLKPNLRRFRVSFDSSSRQCNMIHL